MTVSTLAIERLWLHIIAYRIWRYQRRSYEMSRLTEKLEAAGSVARRQHSKIEERADRVIAREADIERQADEAFLPHERMLDEAENGLAALGKELAVLSNNPPLERSTPLPPVSALLPDVAAGVGDLNQPKTHTEPPQTHPAAFGGVQLIRS